MKKKKINSKAIIYFAMRAMTILLMVFSIVEICLTKDDSQRSRSIFVLAQAFAMFVCTTLIPLVEKRWKIDVPTFMEIIFLLFAACHMLLGEIGDYYVKITWWDSMLHTISGGLIAILSFSIIYLLNKNDRITFLLSPGFLCIFAICFSLAAGVVWEVFEYFTDAIAGTNMQRYKESVDPFTEFVGRDALKDTMKDLMLDGIGAVVVGILGYFDGKFHLGLFSKWTIARQPIDTSQLLENEATSDVIADNQKIEDGDK